MRATCPICKKKFERETTDQRFCSPRCKTIDLGNWLDDRYAIPVEDNETEDAENGE